MCVVFEMDLEDQISKNRRAVVWIAEEREFSLRVTRKGQESSGSSEGRRTRSRCPSSASTMKGSMVPGKGREQGKDRERAHLGTDWPRRGPFIFSHPKGFPESGVGGRASRVVTGWQAEGMSSPQHRLMTVLCSQVAVLPDRHGGRGHQLAFCKYNKVELREKETQTFKHL